MAKIHSSSSCSCFIWHCLSKLSTQEKEKKRTPPPQHLLQRQQWKASLSIQHSRFMFQPRLSAGSLTAARSPCSHRAEPPAFTPAQEGPRQRPPPLLLVRFTPTLRPPSHSDCLVSLFGAAGALIPRRQDAWRSEPDGEAWIQQNQSQCTLSFTRHYIFSDISKAGFHLAHKAPHVEHISQPPWNNPFLSARSLPQRPPVKEWNHGTEDAIISVRKRQKSACRRMMEPSVEVCLLVNKAFFSWAVISSDPSFGELPLNQLVPV